MKGAKELSNHKNQMLRILNSINTSKMFGDKDNWVQWLVREDINQLFEFICKDWILKFTDKNWKI